MARNFNTNVHFHDIPDAILSSIFSLITDTRSRNAMSLVCLKWHLIERSTRTCLSLRGNIRDLFLLPTCFRAVTNLDLSLVSPWGRPILDSSPNTTLLAQVLHCTFPSVVTLTVYARNPSILHLLAPQWPNLRRIKLVRWHMRSPTTLGSDFLALFEHCHSLASLDLSHFYCWTEDLPPALEAYPSIAASLSHLNVLNYTSADQGFKSHEILAITSACPNLREFLAACIFDHRYIGFVGDETLLSLATNCPRLSLLHLVDSSSLSAARGDPDNDGYTTEDARIRQTMLIEMFSALPLLEELVLDVCHNVRDTGVALEMLNSKCPRLKSLKLGQFHGICKGIDARPDGIALCSRLESLSIKNCADLTDSGLISISLGCPRLTKFEVQGCKKITKLGMTKLASILRKTLTEVKISCCKHLNTVTSLQALEPIRDCLQRLHIDCVWEMVEQSGSGATSSAKYDGFKCSDKRRGIWEDANLKKKYKYNDNENGYASSTWAKLQCLSLWIAVGELLNPLVLAGILDDCPMLEEIQIKVEGDCRHQSRLSPDGFGLSFLQCYPRLSKMHIDCQAAIGYALTAPSGHADLSPWERFYLNGIGRLNLTELNYWPPQDIDYNKRSLSLPAAGLLAQCRTMRKLFVHGTANEHFMMFLLKVQTLRDVQLREDYYPAPENDNSTEMRIDSCSRFEDALNRRAIPD